MTAYVHFIRQMSQWFIENLMLINLDRWPYFRDIAILSNATRLRAQSIHIHPLSLLQLNTKMMEGSQRDSSDSPRLNCSPSKMRTDSFRQSFNDLPPLPTAFDDGTFHHETSVTMAVDDFSEREHDQLPAVESYKATVKSTSGATGFEAARRSHRRKVLLVVAGAIVFATICLTLGFVIGRDEKEAEEKPATTATNKAPRYPPTGSPATYSYVNNHPTPTIARPSRADSVSAFVSTSGWSQLETLIDPESPQSLAVNWIADSDPLYLDLADVDDFRIRYALAVIYYALNGPLWTYDIKWMSINHVCDWNDDWPRVSGGTIRVGTECDTATKTIRSIFLPSMNLKGEIPPEIGLLTGLSEIDMFNNDVIGVLPSEIKKLTSLAELVLHGNFLSGSVPAWLSEIPSLETIDLARNSLKGSLPSTFGKLTALKTLNLEFNSLTGTLDPLKDVKSIEMLSLCDNKISGDLSFDIFQSWSHLVELDLSNNQLVGYLPSTLFESAYLEVVDLHQNQFEGSLPSSVSVDQKLEILSLSNNKLSGSMEVVTLLPYLHHLDLSYNEFDGTMPGESAICIA
jgi:Leucine rich repeat